MTALYTLAGQLIELQKLSDVDSDVVIADTLDAVEGEFNKKAASGSILRLYLRARSPRPRYSYKSASPTTI